MIEIDETWMGPPPVRCELCPKVVELTFVDGKTTYGGWAIMCDECHAAVGAGLGIGHGQRYEKRDGTFVLADGGKINEDD